MNSEPTLSARATQSAARPVQVPDDVLSLGGLAVTLWRGKWILFLAALLTTFLGGYYAYVVAQPLFRSTAVVVLNSRQEQVVDIESVVSGLGSDSTVVNTEVQVLKSRSLLGKVVDDLDLISDPEFNRYLQEPGLIDQAKAQVKGFLNLGNTSQRILTDEERRARERSASINALLNGLQVRNIAQSLAFHVTVESTSARKSALIADTLVQLYILDQVEAKYAATEQATTWLSGRVSELQVALEDAEGRVKDFRSNIDLVSDASLEASEVQLKATRDRLDDLVRQREDLVVQLAAMTAAQTREEKAEASGETRLIQLLPRVNEQAIGDAFDTQFDRARTRVELELTRADAQRESLELARVELTEEISRQSSDLIQLQQLTREAEASRALYEFFLGRLKETATQQGIHQADSRILSNSVPALEPSAPRKSLILAMSMVFGLMLGTGLVLLREARNNAIRSASELEKLTGYSVAGTVPRFPKSKANAALQYLLDKPMSASAEAIRNLRTSILLSSVDRPPQVIGLTSCFPGEGKTTLSAAIAQNMHKMGKSVLLIDGDIRRHAMKRYMTEKPKYDIVTALTEELDWRDAIVRNTVIGADLMPSAKTAVNAADFLSSQKFHDFLLEARAEYDQIIIDTPPVLIVPDARVVAGLTDCMSLIVSWNRTEKRAVLEALNLFQTVQRPIDNLILNLANPKVMSRYSYQYGYGSYGGYGSRGASYYTD